MLLFAAGYWRLLAPMREDYERAEGQLAELQSKIQEGRAAKQELPKFREEVRQLELELDKLLRILPARRNTPDLMRRIRSLAEQGDFSLKKFNPGTLSDKEFFSEWPISVDLEGSYHNLALLLRPHQPLLPDHQHRGSGDQGGCRRRQTAGTPKDAERRASSTRSPPSFTAKTFVYKEPEPETPADARRAVPGTKAAEGAAARPADGEGPASRIRSGGAPAGGPD